jgi:hypothetical protein
MVVESERKGVQMETIRYTEFGFSIQLFFECGCWGYNVSRNGVNVNSSNPRFITSKQAEEYLTTWISTAFSDVKGILACTETTA